MTKPEIDERAPYIGDMLDEALNVFVARAEGRDTPIATPWKPVNEALGGGLWPGFYVVAGATGDGKSQWALQVAMQAQGDEKKPCPVLYVALELGKSDFVARTASLLAGRNSEHSFRWSEMWRGKDKKAINLLRTNETFRNEFKSLRIRFEEGPLEGWHTDFLRERITQFRAEYPAPIPLLVVIDYLQLVSSADPRADLRERISRVAKTCRHEARQHSACILALSSVSRDNSEKKLLITDGEEVKSPASYVGLGKESGEIEFCADGVFALRRGEWTGSYTKMELVLAKQRAGPTNVFPMRFNGNHFESGT